VISRATDNMYRFCLTSRTARWTMRAAVLPLGMLGSLLASTPAAAGYPDLSNPLVRSLVMAGTARLGGLSATAQVLQPAGAPDSAALNAVDVNHPDYKYPGRATLMSLVVPGAGQLYARRIWKTVLFLGIEAAAISAWSSYSQQGADQTEVFEQFADDHWDFRLWLTTASLYQTGQWGEGDGQVYVGPDGTHHLEFFVDMDEDGRPEIFGNTSDNAQRIFQILASPDTLAHLHIKKNGEYYENIGKYNQFFSGWDDADPFTSLIEERDSGPIAISVNRSNYLGQRTEANRLKSVVGYAVSALMFNHVISAMDAIFTASRWNREHARRISARLWFEPTMAYGVGGVQVSFAW
ncbi:MAG: DUF5683 domain-containing protein, partial [Candidatus Neomarinimicrobiota bacterium]